MNTPCLRVLQVVSSSATSGAERQTLLISKRLARDGHHVEVVCPPIEWMVNELEQSGIHCHPIDMRAGWGLPAIRRIAQVTKAGRFQVIHAHLSRATYLGLVVGTARGVPLVSTVHVETKEPVYKFSAHGKNRLVAVSNFIRGVLRGQGVRDRFIDVVYNGTDFSDVTLDVSEDVHVELGLPAERRLVGLVGRVAEEKGHGIAVAAMPRVLDRHPDTHLLCVGRQDGDYPKLIQDEVHKLGIADRVTFTGHREDVARLFDAMHFSILPSVMESFGLAVIECMARGRPVVASNVGALSELIIPHETGLLVENNPESFYKGMDFMLAHDDERLRMGENAERLIREKFTLDQMVERLEAVYVKAAGLG
ncbi:MAG: glycosyltransferase family 4 protein [Armatimonadetes bacterium]|nr:glycosyltransferase family 4 protein [Armatimonadota bacterium]